VSTPLANYRIHGLPVQISSEQPRLLEVIHRRLRHFDHSDAAPVGPPLLRVDFQVVAGAAAHVVGRPSGPTRVVLDAIANDLRLRALYRGVDDVLYIECGDGIRAWIDAKRGCTTVSIARDHAEREWLLSHPVLGIALLEGLRRHGLFSLHAATVSIRGQGLLVAGVSGSGKSTLAVALARAGCGFLGDDTVFLTAAGEGVDALAFPDEVDVSERTMRFFPELARLADEAPRRPRQKRGIFIEDVCAVEVVDRCSPAVLVLPRVADAPASVLREADPEDVFVELVSNVMLTDPGVAQAHLDAVAALVKRVRCYRLETGRDLDVIAARLRDLLDAAVPA
jgi:hypothetical protein